MDNYLCHYLIIFKYLENYLKFILIFIIIMINKTNNIYINNELITNNDLSFTSNFFYNKNPCSLIDGLSKGIYNVGSGTFFGLASLVIAPYILYKENGNKGIIQGLFVGSAGLICMPILGIIIGTQQIVKGIINTPKSIYSKYNGNIWDSDNNKWVNYNLKHETEFYSISLKDFKNNFNKNQIIDESKTINNIVKDDQLYKILEINTNANDKDIKKAYYKLAKKYHPDKTKNSNTSKFKDIAKAYQILGNNELKVKYDKYGLESLENKEILNSKNLYTLLIGNENLYKYTGELLVTLLLNLDDDYPFKILNFKLKKKNIFVANNLCKILNYYFENNVQNSKIFYTDERNKLSISILDKFIICIIGKIYTDTANNYLKKKININNFKNYFYNRYHLIKSLTKLRKNQTDKFIYIILDLIILDLNKNLNKSCNKILYDHSVSKNIRLKRASGLLFIGKIFNNYNINYKDIIDYLKFKI